LIFLICLMVRMFYSCQVVMNIYRKSL